MHMLIFSNSGREASQGGSLGRNTSCSYETLGFVRSVGFTAVPERVWTPVSAGHSPLEAAMDWWCGLGGYQMKKSQAADGSWGKWWRACGLSETKMDQQGDRRRPPQPPTGGSAPQQSARKGPYLPSLSGWISRTARTCPSGLQSSASRADDTRASRFWSWCQPWDQRQTSGPWEEASPRTPSGSNWSPLGLSEDSGPAYHCLLSHTSEGQRGKALQDLKHIKTQYFERLVAGTGNICKRSQRTPIFFSLQAKVGFIQILLSNSEHVLNTFHVSDTKVGPLHLISLNSQDTPMWWALSLPPFRDEDIEVSKKWLS